MITNICFYKYKDTFDYLHRQASLMHCQRKRFIRLKVTKYEEKMRYSVQSEVFVFIFILPFVCVFCSFIREESYLCLFFFYVPKRHFNFHI